MAKPVASQFWSHGPHEGDATLEVINEEEVPTMDNAGSIIDGSLAMAGLIASAVGSVWALLASNSTTTVEMTKAGDALRPTLKNVA